MNRDGCVRVELGWTTVDIKIRPDDSQVNIVCVNVCVPVLVAWSLGDMLWMDF